MRTTSTGFLPRATYRVQFSSKFTFRDAAALAPYLADLGVSHLYASPYFAARPGSTHGYDIVDHNRLNPELGDEADFAAMSEALRAQGLGLIADFVPNHMGVGGAANRFWLNLLEWGARSPAAELFDVEWSSPVPGLKGKVLAPFLGGAYGKVLEDGGFELKFDAEEGAFAIWAHGAHKLPVRLDDYAGLLRGAADLATLADAFEAARGAGEDDPRWGDLRGELARAPDAALEPALRAYRGRKGDLASWSKLDALIERQNWRAAKFTFDAEAINYRRFFTVSELAGLRVEDRAIFDAIHRLLLRQLAEGVLDGVRIDHIDGLRDPKGYALRLREAAGRDFYFLVEKILAADERLPEDWRTDGTTGYEFGNLVVGIMVDPQSVEALGACYADFTGRREAPEEVVHAAKLEMMNGRMAAEVDRLARRLRDVAQGDPRSRDLGFNALRAALVEVIAGLDVYRTYADSDGMNAEGGARLEAALERARGRLEGRDPSVLAFVGKALSLRLDGGEARECAVRMQQVSGPVMAKGLEDTALYRFNRLIALNEVGSEPGLFALDVEAFHAANAERLAREPFAMLTTSTHDTKRGEDARMRIAAISWDVERWRRDVFAWRDLLRAKGPLEVDANEEYFFYQLLLGAWPGEWAAEGDIPGQDLADLRARVEAAMLKSLREAGVNTRWVFGDEAYEARLCELIDRAFDPAQPFLAAFRAAAAHFAGFGASASLAQAVLKLTVPGMPDVYQGAEFWEQSLVDPDNRRDVDFPSRIAALAEVRAGRSEAAPVSPRGKLAVTARLLALRKERPGLFATGSYEPLRGGGADASRVCAYLRRSDEGTLLVAVALGWDERGAGDFGDALAIPEAAGGWRDVLSAKRDPVASDRQPFAAGPVCVLFSAAAD